MTVKLKRCSECSFLKTERMYTDDSFEMAFDWFCKAENERKITGYVEAFDKPAIPDWCPLRKADMIDTSVERKIQAGDLLVACDPMSCESGFYYVPGMIFEVLEETDENPHNMELLPGNKRWKVRCAYQTSVWCTLESTMKRGHIRFMADDEVQVPIMMARRESDEKP